MSSAQQVARLRQATGMGWLQARMFLAGRSKLLCERIVTAREKQPEGILHDPIEDDTIFAEQLADAKKKAQEKFESWLAERNADCRRRGLESLVSNRRIGSCHFIWREMKKVLQEQHGIEWFSPAEMNPGTKFD